MHRETEAAGGELMAVGSALQGFECQLSGQPFLRCLWIPLSWAVKRPSAWGGGRREQRPCPEIAPLEHEHSTWGRDSGSTLVVWYSRL